MPSLYDRLSTNTIFCWPAKMDRRRPEYERLCVALRDVRLECGVSQTELARRLGIYQVTISRIEVGERRVDVVELVDIAKALDVSVVDILRYAQFDVD